MIPASPGGPGAPGKPCKKTIIELVRNRGCDNVRNVLEEDNLQKRKAENTKITLPKKRLICSSV